MWKSVLASLVFACFAGQAWALDLMEAVEKRSIEIVSVEGTGASSGMALTGLIRNPTAETVEVEVLLPNALYFDNAGAGQDMVATQIYLTGGSYYTDSEGEVSFISVEPGATVGVVFVAYCAEFERANPSPSEGFSLAPMPASFAQQANRIAQYTASYPNDDLTVAAQVALWLAQGHRAEEIQTKFPFTPDELRIALDMIQ